MNNKLFSYMHKPELYEKSTSKFWNDSHISKSMLEAHLNPIVNGATRNLKFVERSVNWISTVLPPENFPKLLDLGCGPGIYAEKFYEKSYDVSGMDFSQRSIEYAKKNAKRRNMNINYFLEDYLEFKDQNVYNLISMIYCDFGVLSTNEREKLLKNIYEALKPGGAFIFDVFTPKYHEGKCETKGWEYLKTGFYSENPHVCLHSFYRYDEFNTVLNQCITISEDSINCYNIWEYTFTEDELRVDLKNAGFESVDLYGNIAGEKYDVNGDTICIIARKK